MIARTWRLAAGATGMAIILVWIGLAPASAQEQRPAQTQPPGAEKSGTTKALETGARLLQSAAPLRGFDVYLVGFHPMKDDPALQMEAHHYCEQVNEDFAQCVLFDGNTDGANLNGIEYIISEALFDQLPEEERQYWHPHNGEILSGQLRAPGILDMAEHELMEKKMNSYGKTWHVWHTGEGSPNVASLPLGPAMLAWSFNRDGEINEALLRRRDEEMDLDTQDARKRREDLRPLARPQVGVDALKDRFEGPTADIPGVVERK